MKSPRIALIAPSVTSSGGQSVRARAVATAPARRYQSVRADQPAFPGPLRGLGGSVRADAREPAPTCRVSRVCAAPTWRTSSPPPTVVPALPRRRSCSRRGSGSRRAPLSRRRGDDHLARWARSSIRGSAWWTRSSSRRIHAKGFERHRIPHAGRAERRRHAALPYRDRRSLRPRSRVLTHLDPYYSVGRHDRGVRAREARHPEGDADGGGDRSGRSSAGSRGGPGGRSAARGGGAVGDAGPLRGRDIFLNASVIDQISPCRCGGLNAGASSLHPRRGDIPALVRDGEPASSCPRRSTAGPEGVTALLEHPTAARHGARARREWRLQLATGPRQWARCMRGLRREARTVRRMGLASCLPRPTGASNARSHVAIGRRHTGRASRPGEVPEVAPGVLRGRADARVRALAARAPSARRQILVSAGTCAGRFDILGLRLSSNPVDWHLDRSRARRRRSSNGATRSGSTAPGREASRLGAEPTPVAHPTRPGLAADR